MAGLVAEGTLYIDPVDFWEWADVDEGMKAEFSIEENAWVFTKAGADVQYTDATAFWTWVLETQMPGSLRGLETRFGVPRLETVDLVLTFAVSSEGDPQNWVIAPKCLAEWEQ